MKTITIVVIIVVMTMKVILSMITILVEELLLIFISLSPSTLSWSRILTRWVSLHILNFVSISLLCLFLFIFICQNVHQKTPSGRNVLHMIDWLTDWLINWRLHRFLRSFIRCSWIPITVLVCLFVCLFVCFLEAIRQAVSFASFVFSSSIFPFSLSLFFLTIDWCWFPRELFSVDLSEDQCSRNSDEITTPS